MTTGEWIGLVLQVVATGAAAAAAIAAWRSVVAVSKERKADARWRAAEHLKHIHALITEWSQNAVHDRRHAFAVLMALRSEVHVVTELEGPLPRCMALANTDASTIMPDDVSGLAEGAINEVEAAQVRVWKGHTVDLS
jgi:ribosomal protein L17